MRAEQETLHSIYAQALFEYGKEYNLLDALYNDFEKAVYIFQSEKVFLKIIKHPRIGLPDKEHLLDEIGKNIKISRDFVNFTKLLINKKRFNIFHGIFLKFTGLYDSYKNRTKVFLYSSTKLDKQKIDNIKNTLKRTIKKDIIIEERQDETLVGGIKIQIEDKIYDGSIKKELENIKETISI